MSSLILYTFLVERHIRRKIETMPAWKSARACAALSQIQSIARQIKEEGGSYINLSCTYNESMKNLCKEIEKMTGMKPTIYASEEEYCAYIKLLSEDKYYCISASGGGYTEINPAGTNYCNGITFTCPFKD